MISFGDQSKPRKAFYYDCFNDVKAKDESDVEFKKRMDDQERSFDAIRALPGYHVRLGTVSGTYKRLRQKQVDVLLAVDVLSHAFNKNMDEAILIAGDLDFKPVIDALIQRGTFATVLYTKASASSDLYWAADTSEAIGIQKFWQWSSRNFKAAYRLPHVTVREAIPHDAVQRRNGIADGNAVRLLERGRTFIVHAVRYGGESNLTVSLDGDLSLLEKFFGEVYAPIQWT